MEKYTESDILKLEIEIRIKQTKLEAMKRYHSAYTAYKGLISEEVRNDFAYDDLMREYHGIKIWLTHELGLIAEDYHKIISVKDNDNE